jgi:porin
MRQPQERGTTFPSVIGGLALWAVLGSVPARAAPPAVNVPLDADSFGTAQPQGGGAFGFLDGISRSNYMLGDLFGARTVLSRYGISLGLQETSEVLGNITGGSRHGFDYDGLTQAVLQLDTERAFGLHGGTFNISALQIHGRNLSTENLQSLQTASGIEADRSTRLWELWYQQKFLDEDRLDIKIGQQSLDQEFMVTQNGSYFVNTMFGWPMLPSADLPGGGPAYPLSALGVRVRARPLDEVSFLLGVFNGSPVHTNSGDPQMRNPSGTSFPLDGGALVIAELQYSFPSLGTMVSPDSGEPLSRTYKVGFWYDTERFADQRVDTNGLSLANPASNGTARTHKGNFAVYGVADQMIWRSFDEPDRNVNLFVRAMGTPLGDRNLISFSLNAGLTMHEPFLHRDDDTFAIGMGYAQVSGRASGLDADTGTFGNPGYPVRGGETFLEATYQYQVTPWLQVQPDAQYVFKPGAGLPNPNKPGQTIKNETVIGLRTNIQF